MVLLINDNEGTFVLIEIKDGQIRFYGPADFADSVASGLLEPLNRPAQKPLC